MRRMMVMMVTVLLVGALAGARLADAGMMPLLGGVQGEPIGHAELNHVRLGNPPPGMFLKPEGARAQPMPKPGEK